MYGQVPIIISFLPLLVQSLLKDTNNDGYRIDHIYKSDPDYPDELSPLARDHSKIKTGDIITHINGVSVLKVDHPSELLRKNENKQVRLTLKSGSNGKPMRK